MFALDSIIMSSLSGMYCLGFIVFRQMRTPIVTVNDGSLKLSQWVKGKTEAVQQNGPNTNMVQTSSAPSSVIQSPARKGLNLLDEVVSVNNMVKFTY